MVGMMNGMEHTIFGYVVVAVLGLIAGSFAGATVWRLRARQLKEDKKAGEKVSQREVKRVGELADVTVTSDYSRCLSCHHRLAWYDLIPLVSWVMLRGKCRYCKEPIGCMEPLIELGMMAFFVASYAVWSVVQPLDIVSLVLWLVVGTGLGILLVYDLKWFLLPNRVVFPLMAVAAVYAGVQVIGSEQQIPTLITLVQAAVILSGLYYILYQFSRWRYGDEGAWIGFGDVKLGLILALTLVSWQQAFLCLFLANLLGCVIVLPQMVRGAVTRKTQVPFGPMLIAGWVISGLCGATIIAWYMHLMIPAV